MEDLNICRKIKIEERRKEHRLRMSENRVLRGIFGLKRDEMIGDWRNCIVRSFIYFHSPPNTVRIIM
jgi:hypothetical protein